MDWLVDVFNSSEYGPEEERLLREGASSLAVDPDALKEITSEDAEVILDNLDLEQALALAAPWMHAGLVAARDLYLRPPPDCIYEGFGVICVAKQGEISFGPYLRYTWRGEEQRYIQHSFVLVRTSQSGYGVWGSSIESLIGWPDLARLDYEVCDVYPEDDEEQ